MVLISWCLKTKNGLELVEPNNNMSQSYLQMAEESIRVLQNIKDSQIWTATTTYYIFYYSLYAFMLRAGIKCEIHSCSIEFMKQFLTEHYTNEDISMIQKAFQARIDLQYYADRPVDQAMINETKKYCKEFYIKTKLAISTLSEDSIHTIREELVQITTPENIPQKPEEPKRH
ncbi:hypothetical protein HZB03_02740 [Candidatus Woesearchaeota archaeon]|nr:hypothetical protein [Candidatus Woesearchaeota archaeon]